MDHFLDTNTTIVIVVVLCVVLYYLIKSHDSSSGFCGNALDRFTKDLTRGQTQTKNPVIGREDEIERIIEVLSRRTKNNPMLLGEPGVGKTAIVEGLAKKINDKNVPDGLIGKRVLALDLGGIISGTKYRGEFESRIKQLIDQLIAAKREVILFIDEAHMLAQAKGTEGALNVSDMIKPALAKGELQVIGATTYDEYEKYIKPDETLDRRFQPVVVDEPTKKETLEVLKGIKKVYEDFHKVKYSDEALKAAVELSKKYIPQRFLPDKAIDLIDEAGARVHIQKSKYAKHAAHIAFAAGEHANKKNSKSDIRSRPVVTKQDINFLIKNWKE
ncbi:MAG: AAA family ATPase [Patescibacteria group bacterium]